MQPAPDSSTSPNSPTEAARAAGRLTLTGRQNEGDDGIVKLVVKVRIPGDQSSLLDALDAQTLTPEQRAPLLAQLVGYLEDALDAKHGPGKTIDSNEIVAPPEIAP